MKKSSIIILFLQVIIATVILAQPQNYTSNSFTESTPDSTKFRIYMDSIRGFSLNDYQVVKRNVEKCEQLLAKGVLISDKIQFQYALEMVYFYTNKEDAITAYQIIKNKRHLINNKDIPASTKNTFIYMEAYTSMLLGDYEFAQKTYYKIFEQGIENKDTLSTVQALYSLGQLFYIQDDINNAEKHFLKAYKIESNSSLNGLGALQELLYLVELNGKLENYDNVNKYTSLAFEMIERLDVKDLHLELLLLQSEIELNQKNIIKARNTYEKALQISQKLDSDFFITKCNAHQAKILNEEGFHLEALKIYENLIIKKTTGDFLTTQKWYKLAHETASKINYFEKAYNYSLQSKIIQDSLAKEKKMQQTEYLKIKFDSDQKEKTNQILAAQIAQKQSQNNFLYAIVSLFLLSIFILIWSVFQKRKYNRKLRQEVQNRTHELENSNSLLVSTNEELDQFNKILSHDLKEPLRSIVGFSSLAKKKIPPDSDIVEYLNIIGKSGKQLHQLIEDVSTFQRVGNDSEIAHKEVDTNHLLNTIIESIHELLLEKKARVKFEKLPIIRTHRLFLFLVFKNLIENGVKYNESNPPTIEINYYKKDATHCFQFKDNGIGIALEFQEKVFGMFKRLNNRGTYSGSGMGLSLSQKVMKKIDGTIAVVESEEGVGSIFEVRFPIVDDVDDLITVNMGVAESN